MVTNLHETISVIIINNKGELIITTFQEDNVFGTSGSLTFGPQLQNT